MAQNARDANAAQQGKLGVKGVNQNVVVPAMANPADGGDSNKRGRRRGRTRGAKRDPTPAPATLGKDDKSIPVQPVVQGTVVQPAMPAPQIQQAQQAARQAIVDTAAAVGVTLSKNKLKTLTRGIGENLRGVADLRTAPSAPAQAGNSNGNAGTEQRATSVPLTDCLLYTSPSPRDGLLSRMPSSA